VALLAPAGPALRVANFSGVDDARVCYWKAPEGWFIYFPGAGAGILSLHTVTEHEDGTITVAPSILLGGHNYESVHGYLERGSWRNV